MGRIKILPKHLQEKIAAGEVIERPASVVRELLENSLDAGSTEIRIEILQSGKRMIRVVDNGCGILREDLLLCAQRHATSKISTESDLFNISTLGFRGEALASIAAVSETRITSQAEGEPVGGFVEIKAGELIDSGPATTKGTTVEVRRLFYNTPARARFLKSDRTELYHILSTITEIALCHPGVAFEVYIDRQNSLSLPAVNEYRERILQIFGNESVEGLWELRSGNLHMFVSKEGHFRSSRTNQYIFINGRAIREPSLRTAIYRAYEGILPQGRHPEFFVYLTLNPSTVDFNVHPAKKEVRFRDPHAIYRLLFNAVRGCITSGPEKEMITPRKNTYKSAPETEEEQPSSIRHQLFLQEPSETYNKQILYIGDAFFAVVEDDGFSIFDYHAAHERILYEALKKKGQDNTAQLLFPQQVQLSRKDFVIIEESMSILKQLGFDIEVFGENTFLIRAIPKFLQTSNLNTILSDIARSIVELSEEYDPEDLKDSIAKTIACHKAVRSGTSLSVEEIRHLLHQLQQTEDPQHCPHGRPVRIHFNLQQLKKLFKRS